jgi:hypothetical protein
MYANTLERPFRKLAKWFSNLPKANPTKNLACVFPVPTPIVPCEVFTIVRRGLSLLDGDRLGQVAREIDVQALKNSEPVGNELERDDVEETLEGVDGLGDLDLLSLRGLELLIVRVADDNGLAATSNDWEVGLVYGSSSCGRGY